MNDLVTRQDLTRFFITGNTTKSTLRGLPRKVKAKPMPKKRKKG